MLQVRKNDVMKEWSPSPPRRRQPGVARQATPATTAASPSAHSRGIVVDAGVPHDDQQLQCGEPQSKRK